MNKLKISGLNDLREAKKYLVRKEHILLKEMEHHTKQTFLKGKSNIQGQLNLGQQLIQIAVIGTKAFNAFRSKPENLAKSHSQTIWSTFLPIIIDIMTGLKSEKSTQN